MADVFTKRKRSEIMSKIRSRNTKPEIFFCKLLSAALHSKGFRYRKHYSIVGKPDIVFVKKKIAIFIDGEFWHGYKFNKMSSRLPKKYWIKKIQNNIARDKLVNKELKKLGWKVIRIWENEIKKNPKKILGKVLQSIK